MKNELHGMTIRELIAALADAEEATRRARQASSVRDDASHSEEAISRLAAHEDLIVGELRRREAERRSEPPDTSDPMRPRAVHPAAV